MLDEKEILRKATDEVEKTLANKFYQKSMLALTKVLLCLRKTPEEIDEIHNKIRDLVGGDYQNISIFDGIEVKGKPIDKSKPLDDEFHKVLLYELSLELLKEEFSEENINGGVKNEN